MKYKTLKTGDNIRSSFHPNTRSFTLSTALGSCAHLADEDGITQTAVSGAPTNGWGCLPNMNFFWLLYT